MKRFTFLLLSFLLVFGSAHTYAKDKKKSDTETEAKQKLSTDQKLVIITKELKLNAKEQQSVKLVISKYQTEKAKLKQADLPKKEEKAKLEALKEKQKLGLKKILGLKRFAQYEQLKSKDVI